MPSLTVVVPVTMERLRTHKAHTMALSIPVSMAVHGPCHRKCAMVTDHLHRLWFATIAVLARSMPGSWDRAFPRNTAAHAM